MKKDKQSHGSWYFLLIVIAFYILIAFLRPDALLPSFKLFLEIIVKVIPVFILIFILMVIINLFLNPEKIIKYFGKKSGAVAWSGAIISGIISEGPIYFWYPLLSDLQKKGVRSGLIAAFLYNRAIKLPLIPLMIYYFGLAYVIVLSLVMMIASIFQGIIVEKIVEVKR